MTSLSRLANPIGCDEQLPNMGRADALVPLVIFFSKRFTFRPQSLPVCVLLKLDLSLEQESHMALNLEQLRNEARELYVQCNTTGEDSAVALQRSKEILLSLLLRSASERKFTQKPESS